MIDLGYAVIRSRGRGKKGEFVDLASKLAKGTLTKLFREEKVYFRPKWCDHCRKFTVRTPLESEEDCKECWRRNEREQKQLKEEAVAAPMESIESSERASERAKSEFVSDVEEKGERNDRSSEESTTSKSPDNNLLLPDSEGLEIEKVPSNDEAVSASASGMDSLVVEKTPTEPKNICKGPAELESSSFVCRYERCIQSDRVIHQREKSYIEVSCRDKCLVIFHRSCFNEFKGDVSTKNLLAGDAACMTPDCPAIIIVVRTKDFEGNIKSENSIENEERAKKKKSATAPRAEERGRGKSIKEKRVKKTTPRDGSDESTENRSQGAREKQDTPSVEGSSQPTPISQTTAATASAIEPDIFLHVDAAHLVELKRREEEDNVLRTGVNSKKKKKKKNKTNNELHFRLYPDSSQSLTIPPATALANAASEQREEVSPFSKSETKAVTAEPSFEYTSAASTAPSVTKQEQISELELKETAYRLIESFVRTHGRRVRYQILGEAMDNWAKDIAGALDDDPEKLPWKHDQKRLTMYKALRADPEDRFVTITEIRKALIYDNEYADEQFELLLADAELDFHVGLVAMEFPHWRTANSAVKDEQSITTDKPQANAAPSGATSSGGKRETIETKSSADVVTKPKSKKRAARSNQSTSKVSDRSIESMEDEKTTPLDEDECVAKDLRANAAVLQLAENVQLMNEMILHMHKTIQSQGDTIRDQSEQIGRLGDLVQQQSEDVRKQTEIIAKLERKLNDHADKEKSAVDKPTVEEDEEDEDMCSICMEDLYSQATLQLPRCGHDFHSDCFSQYKGLVCPLCREPLEEEFPPLK